MVRKYFVQQLGLLLMVSVIIILTNVIGYKMPVKDSIIGVLLLSAISLMYPFSDCFLHVLFHR